jgi:putative ABC transport system substrate-binding protein
MKRRDFLALAAGAAAWPLAAKGQAARMRRIGLLNSNVETDPVGQARYAGLVGGLAELGWREGQNLAIMLRWGGGDPALFKAYAAEIVAAAPELIYAGNTPALAEVSKLTTTIPIVFNFVVDPVAQGFVPSLSRPGGNISGFSIYDPPMVGKWLQLLKEIAPKVARASLLYNPGTAPYGPLLLKGAVAAAPALGMAVEAAVVHDDAEVEAAILSAATAGGGVIVAPDSFIGARHEKMARVAFDRNVPSVCPFDVWADAGFLISYGVDLVALERRGSEYIDQVLRGAAVGDLPVMAPTRFQLVINLKTARAFGLTVPVTLLTIADRVIQ